jgi:hypothetical protein
MLTLDRAVARNAQAGEPLPFKWQGLAQYATPKRGNVVMVYGPSGSCKSMFTLDWLLSLELPTLYISPDTDQHDMAVRVIARRNSMTASAVEDGIAVGAIDINEELADLRDWFRFDFSPDPTLEDIELEIAAFEEQFGAYPEVIVVDPLSDVHANDEDEVRGWRKIMKALKVYARLTNALIIVNHHSTGEFDGEVTPAPRRAINGKLSKSPSLILSVARNGVHFGLAIVKQRSGFSDTQAQSPVWLQIDPARATVSDRVDVSYTSWTD